MKVPCLIGGYRLPNSWNYLNRAPVSLFYDGGLPRSVSAVGAGLRLPNSWNSLYRAPVSLLYHGGLLRSVLANRHGGQTP
jgi:hypothetical protein